MSPWSSTSTELLRYVRPRGVRGGGRGDLKILRRIRFDEELRKIDDNLRTFKGGLDKV